MTIPVFQSNVELPLSGNLYYAGTPARLQNALMLPVSTLSAVGDTAIGLISSIASFATLGMSKSINKFTVKHLNRSSQILSAPFTRAVTVINPSAVFRFGVHVVREPLYAFIALGDACANSNQWFHREITARLSYVVAAVAAVVTRAVEAVMGLIALPLVVLSLGSIESVNAFVMGGLQSLSLAKDLIVLALKVINPHSPCQF